MDALTRALREEEALAAWYDRHAGWNAGNLETEGVLVVDAMPFVFVHKDHPVIDGLRKNQNTIDQNIDEYPLIDGTYLKVSRRVFALYCDAIRAQIYSRPYPVRAKAVLALQRWARVAPQRRGVARRLALAMALHGRLGDGSPLRVLEEGLLALVAATG